MPEAAQRFTFPASRRLGRNVEYQRVYGSRMRKSRGPLTGFSAPSALPHYRLGLAVGRSVGNAVERHRVKRLIREAFRLSQHTLPRPETGGYDLIVSVRGRAPGTLDEVQRLLIELAALLHAEWSRRRRREEAGP
jgi:ribonuclease P protein component